MTDGPLSAERILQAIETLDYAADEATMGFPGALGQEDPRGVFIEAKRNLFALAGRVYGDPELSKILDAYEESRIRWSDSAAFHQVHVEGEATVRSMLVRTGGNAIQVGGPVKIASVEEPRKERRGVVVAIVSSILYVRLKE